MATKGTKAGPRISVFWANVTKKVKGKKVSVPMISRPLASTATLFGLKESKAGLAAGANIKSIKTTKGARIVLSGGRASVSTEKMYASVDGKTWHQLPIPQGLSLAKAFAMFKAGKKAYAIKFQGGQPIIIGKPSKDTKSKAKTAKEPVKTK